MQPNQERPHHLQPLWASLASKGTPLAAALSRIESEPPMTYEQRIAAGCAAYNATPGAETSPDCTTCHGKGHTMQPQEEIKVMVKCECLTVQIAERRLQRSGLAHLAKTKTFDAFQTKAGTWQGNMKALVQRFADDPCGKWLALLGQSGCGKSHLGVAAAIHIMRHRQWDMRYMAWLDESARLKAVVNNGEEYRAAIEPIKTVRVLYIDDLFKVRAERGGDRAYPTAADVRLAFEILNARYNDPELITIISSEWTHDGLLDIDEAVAGRILERSRGFVPEIMPDRAKNYRLQ